MLQGLDIPRPHTQAIPLAHVRDELPQPDAADHEDLDWRIALYRLLSGAFLEEPSAEFLTALRGEASLAALAEAGLAFGADFLETPTADLEEALAIEYTNLFAASGGMSPVESARLTGRLQQEPCHAVRQTYQTHGFTMGQTRFKVFEDQLGAELAFVAALLERCQQAHDEDDPTEYKRLTKEVKRFWTQHLGKWVRGYASLVQRAADHSFYREMGRLLEAFAVSEIAILGLRIDDQDQARLVVPKSEIQVAFNPDEPECNACGGGGQHAAGPGQ